MTRFDKTLLVAAAAVLLFAGWNAFASYSSQTLVRKNLFTGTCLSVELEDGGKGSCHSLPAEYRTRYTLDFLPSEL
jgi:hypothetical protein